MLLMSKEQEEQHLFLGFDVDWQPCQRTVQASLQYLAQPYIITIKQLDLLAPAMSIFLTKVLYFVSPTAKMQVCGLGTDDSLLLHMYGLIIQAIAIKNIQTYIFDD